MILLTIYGALNILGLIILNILAIFATPISGVDRYLLDKFKLKRQWRIVIELITLLIFLPAFLVYVFELSIISVLIAAYFIIIFTIKGE